MPACVISWPCAATQQRHGGDESGDYKYASELVAALTKIAPFEIGGGISQNTPKPQALKAALDNLKRKVDAGATRIITQFFAGAENLFEFP